MASKPRLLVKEAFDGYVPGDRITDASEIKRVTASHPDYVLREAPPQEPDAAPPAPAETVARTEAGLPPGPVKVAAPKARVTDHTIND